jgi:hypothetical protein
LTCESVFANNAGAGSRTAQERFLEPGTIRENDK